MKFLIIISIIYMSVFAKGWSQSEIKENAKLCEREMAALSRIEEANIPSSLDIKNYCECFISNHTKHYTPASFKEYYTLMLKSSKSDFISSTSNPSLSAKEAKRFEKVMSDATANGVLDIGLRCFNSNNSIVQ